MEELKPQLYDIVDCNGCVMTGHYTDRPRTLEEAEKLIKRLNEHGKYRPYKKKKTS